MRACYQCLMVVVDVTRLTGLVNSGMTYNAVFCLYLSGCVGWHTYIMCSIHRSSITSVSTLLVEYKLMGHPVLSTFFSIHSICLLRTLFMMHCELDIKINILKVLLGTGVDHKTEYSVYAYDKVDNSRRRLK